MQLSDGRSTIAVSNLAAGGHSLVAYYPGNGSFAASTSAPVVVDITAPSTTTTITASADSIPQGQFVTFTAAIACSSSDTMTPTGSITFKDEDRILGYSLVGGGEASFTASSLGEGQHTITAVYSGDTQHLASTSRPLTQTVTHATVVDLMAL
jgi:hypothetical protein